MKNTAITLIATHTAVFLTGVVIGKKMDADELNMYRDAHESRFTKFVRKATNVAIGLGDLSTFVVIVRVGQRASASSGGGGAPSTTSS